MGEGYIRPPPTTAHPGLRTHIRTLFHTLLQTSKPLVFTSKSTHTFVPSSRSTQQYYSRSKHHEVRHPRRRCSLCPRCQRTILQCLIRDHHRHLLPWHCLQRSEHRQHLPNAFKQRYQHCSIGHDISHPSRPIWFHVTHFPTPNRRRHLQQRRLCSRHCRLGRRLPTLSASLIPD